MQYIEVVKITLHHGSYPGKLNVSALSTPRFRDQNQQYKDGISIYVLNVTYIRIPKRQSASESAHAFQNQIQSVPSRQSRLAQRTQKVAQAYYPKRPSHLGINNRSSFDPKTRVETMEKNRRKDDNDHVVDHRNSYAGKTIRCFNSGSSLSCWKGVLPGS